MSIVTIDFDIIMKPSIGIYNDLIDEDYTVEDYLKEYPFLEHSLFADLYIYEYLTRYLVECCKYKIPIRFIKTHDEIVKIAEEEFINPMTIINIDHHHDIGYGINFKKKLSELTCGNWVKYLKDKKLIDKYIWVKNENSDPIADEGKNYLDEEYDLKSYPLDLPSEIIICASYEWIPLEYYPLLSAWESIVEVWNDR